ncbi:MAG: thioredoxin [Oscillospiraceae bacterium]|nr:thioredoxin [Oscillospiraceae bacterium]MDY4586392.1 thioredoxin [Oscillospiraceae bacterium]
MMEVTITKENFEQVVLKSDKPVLVDFWATWCGPCKMLSPIIEEVRKETEGKAVVGKINVDEQQELAMQFGVMSIPTLLVFKNGEIVKKQIGFIPKQAVLGLLDL